MTGMCGFRWGSFQNINGAGAAAEVDALLIGVEVKVYMVAANTGIFRYGDAIGIAAVVADDIHTGAEGDDALIHGYSTHMDSGAGCGHGADAADACGIDCVIVCNFCNIYNPKTVRSAMGSLMRVPIVTDNIANAVNELKSRGIPVFAAVISDKARSLTECDFSQGGAVIIGNEGNGLSEEDAALADTLLTIKMHGTINSLNAAMAAGIIMWELSKNK